MKKNPIYYRLSCLEVDLLNYLSSKYKLRWTTSNDVKDNIQKISKCRPSYIEITEMRENIFIKSDSTSVKTIIEAYRGLGQKIESAIINC